MRRRPQLLALAALGAALAATACDRQAPPTGLRPGAPALGISDGAHNAGNPDFFFLPPIAASPVNDPSYDAGGFNAKLHPRVEVCRLSLDPTPACDLTVASFPAGSATMDATGQKYAVQWHTDQSNPALELSRFYRIRVLLGTKEIGYVDVDPVSNGSQLKNVNTGEYIGLVDGRTLPINFRIENGALCGEHADCAEQSVTNAGGTVVTNTDFAGAFFPQGWLPDGYTDVVVTIERVPVPPDNQCVHGSFIQFEGCYRFETDPDVGTFAKAVTVGECTEIDETDPRYHYLQLYASDVDEPTHPLFTAPAPFLTSCDAFTGTPAQVGEGILDRAGRGVLALARTIGRALAPRPAYAVHLGLGGLATSFSVDGWVLSGDASAASPTTQDGVAGELVRSAPTVLVMSHRHGDPGQPALDNDTPVPLAGIPVTFTVSSGGGSVGASTDPDVPPPTTITVNTDANGLASVPWTLGASSGTQTVTATAPVLGSPITFSANATAAVSTFGQLVDPSGDNLINAASGNNQPDIIGASVAVQGQSVTFTVDVGGATDVANTLLQFNLDVDENVHTGSPGVDAAGNDATLMGTDYLVNIDGPTGRAQVFAYAGTPNSFTAVTGASATPQVQVGDGAYRVTVVLPASAFGGGNGLMRFKVTAAAFLGEGYTGVMDYAPDLGVAPAQTAATTSIP